MKKFLIITLFSFTLFLLWQSPNFATSSNGVAPVCPEGRGWVKVEGTNPLYTAPLDKEIEEICVMGGGFRHYFITNGYSPDHVVDAPGKGQKEVVSNCWGVSGIGEQTGEAWKNTSPSFGFCPDISHASFKIVYSQKPLDPVCGGFADAYTYDINDWPAVGEFCEVGDPDPSNPVFPTMGETTTWDCIVDAREIISIKRLNNERKTISCEATRDDEPEEELEAVCGGFADEYTYDINDWPAVGEFCEVGDSDPENPAFPAMGGTTSWNCLANGDEAVCEANRGSEPEVLGVKDKAVVEVEPEPEPEVLGAAVVVTDTAGGVSSSVIVMQIILLLSLVSAVWSYLEGESILSTSGKRK